VIWNAADYSSMLTKTSTAIRVVLFALYRLVDPEMVSCAWVEEKDVVIRTTTTMFP